MSYILTKLERIFRPTNSFCEHKFQSMLLSGTFSMSVVYIMLISDSIVAGFYFNDVGVAAINVITPATTGIIGFLGCIVAFGASILYSREMGAMRKERASQLYGLGLILSVFLSALCAVMLILLKDIYFETSGVSGPILELAEQYYNYMPLSSILQIMGNYFIQLIYADGDEYSNTLTFTVRIISNVVFSVLLTRHIGFIGIIWGTIIGNVLGLITSSFHFFRKSNTLHFVWYFSFSDMVSIVRFSVVDAVIFVCWGISNYALIGHVSKHYDDLWQIILAVAMGLVEFCVVLDGVGLAMQPLLETYFGEKNHFMIRRLMHVALRAAIIEGLAANVLIFIFARQFCALFFIDDGPQLTLSIHAVRIISMGLVFCSVLSLTTSYYMLVDHVALSVGITILKEGFLYTVLPILFSMLFKENGMWIGFLAAPILALVASTIFIRFFFGRRQFPYLLVPVYKDTVVMDETLTSESISDLSGRVDKIMLDHGYNSITSAKASLFVEEIGLTILEKNRKAKKPVLIEISILFDENTATLVERDSGRLFDITDTNIQPEGLSGYVLSNLMSYQSEKVHIITTGYNRNVIKFQAGTDAPAASF